MIKNHLKIAVRHLLNNKAFSIINIFGLAIGLACCLVILIYVNDELGYDSFHDRAEDIYRMVLERKYPGRSTEYAIIPHSYAGDVQRDFPEVESSTRMFSFGNDIVFKIGENVYEEPHPVWADSNFFEFFSFNLLEGEIGEVLTKPNSVVLSSSLARKYFGNENAVGKVLDIPQNDNDLMITGICADPPKNSHMRFGLVLAAKGLNFLRNPNHINFSALTYLKLSPGADPNLLESKFPDMVTKYASGEVSRNFGVSYEEYQAAGNGYRYYLQPLKDIYLKSNIENELRPPGSMTRVYIFTVIAIFILFIACVNFMNLATARSSERAKEVGIRKTLGSARSEISLQFLTEAVLISLVSALLAIALLQYLIPLFNDLANKSISLSQVLNLQNILIYVGVSILIGILAGIYPALVISNFKPLEVLRGKLWSTGSGAMMRNSLVVTQFVISVVLIISTIVVYRQLEFIQNKRLGFDKENIISITCGFGMSTQQSETFKNELRKLTSVAAVGGCNVMPGGYFFGASFRPQGDNETITGRGMTIDEEFLSCMNIELLEGRSYSKEFADSSSVILNEVALSELGISDPIGKQIQSSDFSPNQETIENFTIVGVVKDFHFQSLHQGITPLFLMYNQVFPGGGDPIVSVRIKPPQIQQTINEIETLWNRFVPEMPFRFNFLDHELDELYAAEQTSKRVFGLFTLLGIFIACLGLLGLAAYDTQRRTKEIGIRKVLGASATRIIALLSVNFLKLVFIALLIACPIAWFGMRSWLQDFAYSIELSWWIFALAGILAILIAFLTISFEAIRAALANPINALRND